MTQPIGQILRKTRESRGLSIDEAAHATKLRPEKITALEIGDYASFPSNAYARGFLQIYGRYLGVDVTGEAVTLDTHHRIAIDEYQYLSTPNEPREEPEHDLPDLSRRTKPSLKPLLISAAVVIVAFFGFSTYVNWQRITGQSPKKSVSTQPEKPIAAPEPPPVIETPATPPAAATGEAALTPIAEAPPVELIGPTAPVASTAAASVMLADREFLGEPAPAAAPAAPTEPLVPVPNPDRDTVAPQPVTVNEVEVSVATKTWVTIRREDADAAPLFEDYLYPGVRPLKLRGSRFIIEARDPGIVEIRKNGAPIAYQRPGVTVQ